MRYTVGVLLIVALIIGINFIDDQFAADVPEASDAVRVVAIGDSLTFGSGDPERTGYIGRVQQGMTTAIGQQVIVNRYGIRGYRSDQIMVHIQDVEAKQKISQANYIFLFIGTNDFIQAARRDLNSINPTEMEEKRALFQENLTQLIAQIRQDNQFAPLVLIGMYDPYTDFVNHDQLNEILGKWNQVTKGMVNDFPKTYYISTIDLFLDKEKQRYFKDIIHPNPAGYQLIANRVMNELRRNALVN
ncbi:GDSL-type esterase/lipase family protein [Pseudalkalibacillus sp. Hm43]|uniref:GDSL-type esterase/lipase family protein n=1 Tax=Pseudalkalibacillus sp. Hm43 TaxID=3450742 RepID=UPI003F43FD34